MRLARLFALLICSAITAASAQTPPPGQDQTAQSKSAYLPKVGDIMGQTQLRHFKLWFAGSLGNWQLANYEIGQIWDSFDTAAKLYPMLGDVPFAQLLKGESVPPLADMDKAIAAKNNKEFDAAFERLTAACNSCHVAAHVGFIKIKVPTSSPFSDQSFPPQRN
ncbi:MAG: hypothetical protein ACHQAY_13575 [Hyphomicrobiales bacterium]